MMDTSSRRNWMKIPRLDLVVRLFLVLGLVLCIYKAARQGIGAWYFRQGTPEAIATAIQWDPGAALYYDALGNLTHLYADSSNSARIIGLYESAARLSPQNAQYWADLGCAYDWAGRPNEALRAFDRARELFPNSPYINWRLANFLVRTRKTSEALRALRKVLVGGGVPRRDVFLLAANATRDNTAILDVMLPPTAGDLFDFLDFRVAEGDTDAADEVWHRIEQLNLPSELPQVFPYLDGLIRDRQLDALANTWSSLAARFPAELRPRISPGNLIANGSFEFAALNGGLDWRVIPVEGAVVREDSQVVSDGARSLRIDFNGTHNLDYGGIFQYVLVEPGMRFRFSGDMRVSGITTDSGPRFEIFDAYNMGKLFTSTESRTGTSDWLRLRAEFKTNSDTRLLIVRVARPISHKFDNRIAGTVWIDRLSLQQEE